MSLNERQRQKKLARKNAKRKKKLVAQQKAMGELPILLEDYPEKMSDVIIDFAEPLLAGADTAEQMRSAISFAIVAWNIALLPSEKEHELIVEVFDKLTMPDEQERAAMGTLLTMMVARKRQDYGDIDRMVANYQITDTEDGVHLSVASTFI